MATPLRATQFRAILSAFSRSLTSRHQPPHPDSSLMHAHSPPSSRSDARSTNITSLLLIEEHALLRVALRSLLETTDGLRVVAEAAGFEAAAKLAAALQPNVVLVSGAADAELGIPMIRRAAPDACVIALTRDAGASTSHAAAYVPAHAGLSDLCGAIDAALGGRCLTCAFSRHCPVPAMAARLSRRETQVAARIADGMTSKQIATDLGVGLRTVHTYREALSRKLGGSSAAIVTRYVLERGLAARREVA